MERLEELLECQCAKGCHTAGPLGTGSAGRYPVGRKAAGLLRVGEVKAGCLPEDKLNWIVLTQERGAGAAPPAAPLQVDAVAVF